jgi:hypothetical protein
MSERWAELTANFNSADFFPPKHPRYDSIRQRENFYLSKIPLGIPLPCAYVHTTSVFTQIITGWREADTIWYFTFSVGERVPPGANRPDFYVFGINLDDVDETEQTIEIRFPIYKARITTVYEWETLEGRLRFGRDSAIGFANAVQIRNPPLDWEDLGKAFPQCRIADGFRTPPARDAPPPPALWPPRYYDWWISQ